MKVARNGLLGGVMVDDDNGKLDFDRVILPWKQADFYEALAEAQSELGEGVIIVEGHSRRVVYTNAAFSKMFGYERAEILALGSVYNLVSPENLSELTARGALRMVRAQIPDHYEAGGVRKDGSQLQVEISVKTIDGADSYAVALVRDISERKKREHAFTAAYKVIEDLYHQAPCGYHSVDKNGTFVYVNDTLLKWLGYTRDEVIGKLTIANIVPQEAREGVKKFFEEFVKTCTSSDLETQMLRKDGSHFPVLVKTTAATDSEGHFVMSRTMTIDTTQQKKSLEESRDFQESQKRFFAAFKEMQGALESFKS